MLLNNQFKVFNKSGDNINSTYVASLNVSVIDPDETGANASIKAITNYKGEIIHINITNPGVNYGPNTYLRFETRPAVYKTWDTLPGDLVIGNSGELLSYNIPESSENIGWPFPASYEFSNYHLQPVSTGLIESENFFMIEKVWDYLGSNTCDIVKNSNVLSNFNFSVDEEFIGSIIVGDGIPDGTTISSINLLNQTYTISKAASNTLSNVAISLYKIAYTYPRVEEYGPYDFTAIESNGTTANIHIKTNIITGNVFANNKYKIFVNLSDAALLKIGMSVMGTSISSTLTIKNINNLTGEILLSGVSEPGLNLSFTFYIAHGLRIGSKISIHSGVIQGVFPVIAVSTFKISFASTKTVSLINVTNTYGVVPLFEITFDGELSIEGVGDPEWFLYDVEYGAEYPSIQKATTFQFELDNASLAVIPDTFTTGNGELIRIVYDTLNKSVLQNNIGIQADYEGVYVTTFDVLDITFSTAGVIFTSVMECEVEAEDERLSLLLENFGRDITIDQELILRDSDVNEGNTDFILLNQKRKEMLLQGDQIWPYMGTYKGLVNIINWFGYYDISIKEYWLNVNADDTYYGKYKQVPIAFQLKGKGISPESLSLVPSKHYKKSNLFGLFYDINRNSGEYDSFGIPEVEDAFAYTNEEVLIKLFALKGYLKQKFLPLNTRIVDITGEGVYYERYTVNSWSDRNDRVLINLGKNIDFTYDNKAQIVDLRPFDKSAGLLTPEIGDSLITYASYYNIIDVILTENVQNIVYNQSSIYNGDLITGNKLATSIHMRNGIFDEPFQTGTDIGSFEWVMMELDNPYRIKTVSIGCDFDGSLVNNWGKSYTENKDVEYSVDGITWTLLFNTGLFTTGIQTYNVDVIAKYIRIVSINEYLAITEFNVTTNPYGGNFYGEIPQITFPGSAKQQAKGQCRVRAMASDILIPGALSGVNFMPGDTIVLDGGVFKIPIRVVVTSIGNNGSVKGFSISSGDNQGSNYTSLPTKFSTTTVLRPDNVNNQYFKPNNVGGFVVDSNLIPFEIQEVTLYDLGLKYSTIPSAYFNWTSINGVSPTVSLGLVKVESSPVSYFNDSESVKPFADAPDIPIGAIVNVATTFDVTWDELAYPWNTFLGSADATLKGWANVLPNGFGNLVAVEILGTGSDYTISPTFNVNSDSGFGASVTGQIREGKLNIVEYKVSSLNSTVNPGAFNDIITITPAIPTGGLRKITSQKIVKGLGIPEGTFINDIIGNDIYLLSYDNTGVSTSININDKLYVHQGVSVSTGGSNYVENPLISVNGGHTQTLYTWNELGRGGSYQMEWVATLSQPTDPTIVYEYRSGIGTIDELINHDVILPYTGVYSLELIVYDTDNNKSNAIKFNCVTVYIPKADFAFITKNVDECKDTWREFEEIKSKDGKNITAPNLPNQAKEISYDWDNAVGRWVNITFNTTVWNDCDINWDTLSVTDLSDINNPTYPECNDVEVLQISSEDYLEGTVIRYTDSTTTPSTVNPTIQVTGQRNLPVIDPVYDPTDWIFIRKDNVVYQLEVLGSNYSSIGYTSIEIATALPDAFKSDPTKWEVLREIGGTVVVKGNLIYDAATNPAGFKAGEYLKLINQNNTPTSIRNVISAKAGDSTGFSISNYTNIKDLHKQGAYGKVYKIRDYEDENGSLTWNIAQPHWVFHNPNLNDPEISDHVGQIILSPSLIGINPLTEIQPGFTNIKLYVYSGVDEIYAQTFRTKHAYLSTSDSGEIFELFNGDAYVIDVIGISGGNLSELNSRLSTYYDTLISPKIYLEYEYDEFTTKIRYASTGNLKLEYNTFPASDQFMNSVEFGSIYEDSHTNWFYDHGIVSGNYSLLIKNTGVWKNGVGTIITVDDDNYELYRSDTFFTACQTTFDEDYASTHIGTRNQTWRNYEEMIWSEFCGNTYDTLDFTESLWCTYIIDDVKTNGGIKFNEDTIFSFQKIIGGMSYSTQFATALWELNNSDNPGISRFNYSILEVQGGVELYWRKGYRDNYIETILSNSVSQIGAAKLNTYIIPNGVIYKPSTSIYINDTVYGNLIAPGSTVTSVYFGNTIDLSFSSDVIAELNKPIPKKAVFTADSVSGSFTLKNVKGLHNGDLRVGETISGDYLPSYPSAAAIVKQIISRGGMIREIVVDCMLTNSSLNNSYNVEWVTDSITIPHLSSTLVKNDLLIIATAKNPSIDNLGYLLGINGVTFLPPQYQNTDAISTSISHTYPVNNFYEWVGFGKNKVGSFEKGIQEFLSKYRYAQTYIDFGVSPFSEEGWYPADNLPRSYSYTNSPVFSNYLEAKVKGEKLPYERSIGGAYTWEETRMGKDNAKIPAGSSVMLSAEASDIVGKTKYHWRLIDGDNILVETLDNRILWTFEHKGNYDVELTITDTNGNYRTETKKSFLTLYETTE